MKLLSVESSARSASVCVTEDGALLAQQFLNCGLTHSRTLLPMIEQMLALCNLTPADLDAFAVAAGPGSFTGIRIGVATVKGLAMALSRPCVAVSTLEAMASTLAGIYTGTVCPVMDARAGQVYQATFTLEGNTLIRKTPDRAISIDQLGEEIGQSPQILIGDGAKLCYTKLQQTCKGLTLAPAGWQFPRALGVATVGARLLDAGKGVTAEDLLEVYLRAPQAERERLAKEHKGERP